MGSPGSLPDRKRDQWKRGYRFPEKSIPETADQFYLVDQPERPEWQ